MGVRGAADASGDAPRVGRRRFLVGAGAMVGAAAWARVERVSASVLAEGAGGGCTAPPQFPRGIELYRQRFENWSGEIVVDDVWTARASRPGDVVTLANWAHRHGWTIRARGHQHGWSPLTITRAQSCASPVVLVDTTALSSMAMEPQGRGPAAVRVGTGTSMEELLTFLDDHGHGLASVPAVGEVTVGGALAIDGHGAVVAAVGEERAPGEGLGSLSNQIVSLTAVVWDARAGAYRLRAFDRSAPEAAALATHLGRAFLTEVVLRVGPARHLRCRSITGQKASSLFASPASAGRRSFAGLLDRGGGVEAIWFPFTERPWTKVWSVAPTKPRSARRTKGPYNYPFSDSLPNVVNEGVDQLITGPGPYNSLGDDVPPPFGQLVDRVVAGDSAATPLLGQAAWAVSAAGLRALAAQDLWGPAFHTQLYIKWTTLRYTQVGFVVLTSRDHVQQVVHDVTAQYAAMLDAYAGTGSYPVNGALEIRATGVDDPAKVAIPGAAAPLLSAVRPRADHPEWDTAIWVNVLTFPGTEGAAAFFAELEGWVRQRFTESSGACVRAEWSKAWGFTPAGPWTDAPAISSGIPNGFRGAATGPDDWDEARARLAALDPHRIFSNPLLDRLL